MPSAKRRHDTGLIQQLLAEPYRFGFFQAVRVLEHYFGQQEGATRDIVPNRLRFQNTLSLSFPPSEILEAEARDEHGEHLDLGDLGEATIDSITLTPAFFGLLGTNGALPLQYTERLISRETYERDRAARAFFDVFSNRSAALFYAAWKKYRLELHYETDRRSRALPVMLSLAGVNYPSLQSRLNQAPGEIRGESLAYYAGSLWRRPTSAVMVQRVVADYFGVAVRLEQFVARWYRVPPEQRTYLGQNNATLGGGALAGEYVLQCDLCVRLWIGPLDREMFAEFLPGGERARALEKLLQLLTGARLEYEVKLILAPEEIQGARLDSSDSAAGGRLGWDAFLVTQEQTEPRSDAGYFLH